MNVLLQSQWADWTVVLIQLHELGRITPATVGFVMILGGIEGN